MRAALTPTASLCSTSEIGRKAEEQLTEMRELMDELQVNYDECQASLKEEQIGRQKTRTAPRRRSS